MPVNKTSKTVEISLESGAASATIYYYGASVTSWKVSGKEKLFLSGKASLDGSKAIRGGIPICWPIFGPPPTSSEGLEAHSKLSQHGFARNHDWAFDSVVMDRPEGVSVRFTLQPNPSITAIFPHPFHLAYVVTLTAHELSTDLHVTNPEPSVSTLSGVAAGLTAGVSAAQSVLSAVLPESISGTPSQNTDVRSTVEQKAQSQELKFQALFHTYLRVEDSSKIKIKGIPKGVGYVDKVKGGSKETWEGGDLEIGGEVDRVYHDVGKEDITLEDGADKLTVHRVEFPDCTTWNPQEATGSKIADMEETGWERYVCIEPGYVKEFKTLQPGEQWTGQQVLKVARD